MTKKKAIIEVYNKTPHKRGYLNEILNILKKDYNIITSKEYVVAVIHEHNHKEASNMVKECENSNIGEVSFIGTLSIDEFAQIAKKYPQLKATFTKQ